MKKVDIVKKIFIIFVLAISLVSICILNINENVVADFYEFFWIKHFIMKASFYLCGISVPIFMLIFIRARSKIELTAQFIIIFMYLYVFLNVFSIFFESSSLTTPDTYVFIGTLKFSMFGLFEILPYSYIYNVTFVKVERLISGWIGISAYIIIWIPTLYFILREHMLLGRKH